MSEIKQVLDTLADMVGQHASKQESIQGANVVPEPVFQADEAAVAELLKYGYLRPRGFRQGYVFTVKAGVWGPRGGE